MRVYIVVEAEDFCGGNDPLFVISTKIVRIHGIFEDPMGAIREAEAANLLVLEKKNPLISRCYYVQDQVVVPAKK